MNDLISRTALLKECEECQKTDPRFEERGWANHFINEAGEPSTEWYCVEDMIENAPTIDAIPVEVAAKKLQRSFHSENWESWAEWLRGNYTDEDFVAHKDDKRNAIPVEWLEWRIMNAKYNGIKEAADAFEFVLKCWKEQEANNGPR